MRSILKNLDIGMMSLSFHLQRVETILVALSMPIFRDLQVIIDEQWASKSQVYPDRILMHITPKIY